MISFSQSILNEVKLPNEAFFKTIKERMVKAENPYLYNSVKDETQKIYDLSKYDNEILIMNKLVQNEDLTYQEKIKIQTLVYNEKSQDFVVLFTQFLENYLKKQNQFATLRENNYCFMRDMIFRIMIRRLSEQKDHSFVFNLIYVFQFIKYEINNVIYLSKNDLLTDEIFQNDDFWLSAFYSIFAAFKNKNNNSNLLVKELLILNFLSLKNIRKSKTKAVEIMKRVMSLNLGFSIEFILDESENKVLPRNDLIFYKEFDIEVKKTLRIF